MDANRGSNCSDHAGDITHNVEMYVQQFLKRPKNPMYVSTSVKSLRGYDRMHDYSIGSVSNSISSVYIQFACSREPAHRAHVAIGSPLLFKLTR